MQQLSNTNELPCSSVDQKPNTGFSELKYRFLQAMSLSEGSKGESISLLVSGFWQNSVPWSLLSYSSQLRTSQVLLLVALPLLQSQRWSVPSHTFVLISPLPTISCLWPPFLLPPSSEFEFLGLDLSTWKIQEISSF